MNTALSWIKAYVPDLPLIHILNSGGIAVGFAAQMQVLWSRRDVNLMLKLQKLSFISWSDYLFMLCLI